MSKKAKRDQSQETLINQVKEVQQTSPFKLKGTTAASISAIRQMSGPVSDEGTSIGIIKKQLSNQMSISWDELTGFYASTAAGIKSMAIEALHANAGEIFDKYPAAKEAIERIKESFVRDLNILTDELIGIYDQHKDRTGLVDHNDIEAFRLALSLGEDYMIFNERFRSTCEPIVNEITARISEINELERQEKIKNEVIEDVEIIEKKTEQE